MATLATRDRPGDQFWRGHDAELLQEPERVRLGPRFRDLAIRARLTRIQSVRIADYYKTGGRIDKGSLSCYVLY